MTQRALLTIVDGDWYAVFEDAAARTLETATGVRPAIRLDAAIFPAKMPGWIVAATLGRLNPDVEFALNGTASRDDSPAERNGR